MYLFYFDDIQLPLTPSKITTSIGGDNKTFSLVNGGEVNMIKFPKLTSYKFEFNLRHEIDHVKVKANNNSPKVILDFLEKAKKDKVIFTFSIIRKRGNRTYFPTEQKVSVESYDVVEDAEDNSDMVVSIELKQFRSYRTKHALNEPQKRPESVKSSAVSSKAVLKQLELLTDMNLRSGAGTQNRIIATFTKGTKPFAYAEYPYQGTTWYRLKHSKGDNGWVWMSGNTAYVKVLKVVKG